MKASARVGASWGGLDNVHKLVRHDPSLIGPHMKINSLLDQKMDMDVIILNLQHFSIKVLKLLLTPLGFHDQLSP